MLVDEPNVLDQHQKELAARLRGTPVVLVRSEAEYLEFLSAKANKGEGLREIARRKGIERHEIAAIGDYSNDVPMLEYAGVSAAVSNASEDCKASPTGSWSPMKRAVSPLSLTRSSRIGDNRSREPQRGMRTL